jgi:hypothetical protein
MQFYVIWHNIFNTTQITEITGSAYVFILSYLSNAKSVCLVGKKLSLFANNYICDIIMNLSMVISKVRSTWCRKMYALTASYSSSVG